MTVLMPISGHDGRTYTEPCIFSVTDEHKLHTIHVEHTSMVVRERGRISP